MAFIILNLTRSDLFFRQFHNKIIKMDKLYELKLQKIREQKELSDRMHDLLTKHGGMNDCSKLARKNTQAAIAVSKQPGNLSSVLNASGSHIYAYAFFMYFAGLFPIYRSLWILSFARRNKICRRRESTEPHSERNSQSPLWIGTNRVWNSQKQTATTSGFSSGKPFVQFIAMVWHLWQAKASRGWSRAVNHVHSKSQDLWWHSTPSILQDTVFRNEKGKIDEMIFLCLTNCNNEMNHHCLNLILSWDNDNTALRANILDQLLPLLTIITKQYFKIKNLFSGYIWNQTI